MNSLIKILILLLLISCQKAELDEKRIIGIGKQLTHTEFSQSEFEVSDIVKIGNGMKKKIIELKKNATAFEYGINNGDFEEPFGNRKADGILTITTDYKDIGIRLKYDKKLDKFHILGWMTLAND
ncbi:hypothetical protein C8N46_11145 [Kordia periserrulae]|uniref:Uncharacterized protein n=1 Tax=Kordia periserrulae TaxID=701523 RepID=A0A2T6BSH9_9FLAO|nr:hypothetical protein [Kordia periserrulae]PTX58976.1 hypothetical protein C8N46_11145 [Kordia periserrulae]